MENANKKAIGYCRSACVEQANPYSTLVQQADECRAYAKAHGYEITEIIYDSGVSGLSSTQPNLLNTLDEIFAEAGPQDLIAPSVSALSRNIADIAALTAAIEKRGVKLLFAKDDSPNGDMS